MAIDRRFRRLHRLQPSRLSIALVYHLQIHIELRRHGHIHQSLDAFLHHVRKAWGDVEVGDADANLTIVKLFEGGCFEFGEDGGAVGDEEASSAFGGALEADECSVGGGTLSGGLAVESNVMSAQRWLVHLLVKGISLTSKLPQTTRMQRIQARFQSKCLVHLPISRNALHQIESTEPDCSILQKVSAEFITIFGKVFSTHGIVGGRCSHFQGTMGHFFGFFLSLDDVNSSRIPSRQRTLPHSTQIGFAHVTIHELLGRETISAFPLGFVSCIGCDTFRRRLLDGRRKLCREGCTGCNGGERRGACQCE
mmetsp:Transcript_18313/g.28673  ORF Transcript_18313/g.28673 Transcript_18313/m.28673 type:complete len:309 (+) Transcript_18313:573-1499(+)